MSSFLYRLGRACYRFRGRVLLAWAVIIVLVGGLAVAVGGHFDDVFEVPGASSTKALAQLKVTFPEAADASATVLINARAGSKLTDREAKLAVAAWTKVVEEVPFVRGVIEPYNEHVDGLISSDGASGRATLTLVGWLLLALLASSIAVARRRTTTLAAVLAAG